ncbi:hypothetical protein NQ318_021099 [Aromia moschata]|uniref:Uncharacterized protein n=1 Tax=Aromia moschata TaxID=1265417 RepID=A0AAV8XSY3_9CUCU|nr:hypothetical protein NQ318_021099 [Aromia moschata]
MNAYSAHTFLNGLNGLKRDVKRPKTIRTPNGPQRQKRTKTLVEKIGKLIRDDRRLSIRGLAQITGIDKECVRHILHESFNMRKILHSRAKGIKNEHFFLLTTTEQTVKAKATEVLNQLTKRPSSTAFNNGKVLWNGVEIAKGSTLKAKMLLLYLVTNKKCYDSSSKT